MTRIQASPTRPSIYCVSFLCVVLFFCPSASHAKKDNDTTAANDFDPSNEDWGTYYDPKDVFCGKFDCYKILGFDYENFGSPEIKEITKRYRKLSREWHPDKSKHKHAKDRFVKIARAYEVLTTKDVRQEYDKMRYNPDLYLKTYGTSVLWSYAPKTDTTFVLLLLLVIGNVLSWFIQKHRWQMVADRLVKAAVEDWPPAQGGTTESKELRQEALEILAKREAEQDNTATAATESTDAKSNSRKKNKSVKKVSGREKKQLEQEQLQPIVKGLVNDIKDFGGGFHQPTWEDLLIVSLVKLPYKLAKGTFWQAKYYTRRLMKQDLNDEERQVLTARAVGPVIWETSSEEDRETMIKKELWVTDNLVAWNEEQEILKMKPSEQKMYNKLKKRGQLDKLEKFE